MGLAGGSPSLAPLGPSPRPHPYLRPRGIGHELPGILGATEAEEEEAANVAVAGGPQRQRSAARQGQGLGGVAWSQRDQRGPSRGCQQPQSRAGMLMSPGPLGGTSISRTSSSTNVPRKLVGTLMSPGPPHDPSEGADVSLSRGHHHPQVPHGGHHHPRDPGGDPSIPVPGSPYPSRRHSCPRRLGTR